MPCVETEIQRGSIFSHPHYRRSGGLKAIAKARGSGGKQNADAEPGRTAEMQRLCGQARGMRQGRCRDIKSQQKEQRS
jgi:hypothetical protein